MPRPELLRRGVRHLGGHLKRREEGRWEITHVPLASTRILSPRRPDRRNAHLQDDYQRPDRKCADGRCTYCYSWPRAHRLSGRLPPATDRSCRSPSGGTKHRHAGHRYADPGHHSWRIGARRKNGADRLSTFHLPAEGMEDRLPLMNASSMVSELGPVVLYLRYLVRPGHVLIVEEPESHLHPAMQVEFTRQLAALVHAGVRIIVTTHSEWVLEELSNLVLASSLPEVQRSGIGGVEFALRPEDVGAWWFQQKKRPRGSVVREIRLDDSGLHSSTRIRGSTGKGSAENRKA